MNPALRNLYRATSPVYLDDGTPQVTIPSHVLLQGLENQKEYVLGQFYRCKTPSGGLVNAVVNRIWGKKCRIFSRRAGDSSYLFHIPDESTRSWVLQRGLWHVDDCMMFVAPWTPTASLVLPEISTVPIWVTLKNIPNQLYSIPGVSHIASGLGAPMLTNKPRLDPLYMGEAKIMVEVELNKPFPQRVAAKDESGTVNVVDVEYSWLPTKCGKCGQLGHKEARCLNLTVNHQATTSKLDELHSSTVSSMPIAAPVTRSEIDPISSMDPVSFTVPNIDTSTVFTSTAEVEDASVADPIVNNAVVSVSKVGSAGSTDPLDTDPASLSTTIINEVVDPIVDSVNPSASIPSADSSALSITDAASIPSTDQLTTPTIFQFNSARTSDSFPPEVSSQRTTTTEGVKSGPISSHALIINEGGVVMSSSVSSTNPAIAITPSMEAFPSGSFQDVPTTTTIRSSHGRPIKPSQKVQEMGWTVVSGRGKRGRGINGGRGISH